ncbi:MAG: DEAD/DEAH box helicase family protein, partial [Dysgonamonadaceae bacterium]|nr:DEAD/DEAH box helicase family protein [Dysgonamonadaceae bacterium]
QVVPYTEKDLNKIAIWNATGSGKTIIMHINYHQYLFYSQGSLSDDATYILLTPKEGLSSQHLEEYGISNIPAAIYEKEASRLGRPVGEISILENTKLGEKDQETIVSVKRFGNRNVVFVDEGHRGSSSGKDGKWQKFRDELCSNGFSFEYSATFGQAIAASDDASLLQRYLKCIIFDYSYKHFWGDGYGKDFNIINLTDDSDEEKRQLYLTGCLMSYYQQKKLHLSSSIDLKQFNIENPLLVFVGASVNAVRTERGEMVSDVVDILLFLKGFLDNRASSISRIKQILSGNTGLLDSENRDIFRNSFIYLFTLGLSFESIYSDIRRIIFNCNSSVATLHIERLRGIEGEIRLRLGDTPPFGVINVTKESELLNLCEANGLNTGVIDFTESLFDGITKTDSAINILIGSKKFTEGWNCWRVSTMGFMNVGRSEGSEIIQLFGRGVRLKGYDMSLKRSNAYNHDFPDIVVPEHISILETLNVFGVRADYMKQFREYLEREGVPNGKGQPIILELPVRPNKAYKKSKLYSLRLKNNADFKTGVPKLQLKYNKDIFVELDCYAKVQFESYQERKVSETTKHEDILHPKHLAFLNYDTIYYEVLRHKTRKARHNVNITKQAVYDLLNNYRENTWYKLLIAEEELNVRTFSDYKRFEKIAITLLSKYVDRFCYIERSRWEFDVGYELVSVNDEYENFLNEEKNRHTISIYDTDKNATLILWLRSVIAQVNKTIENKQPIDITASQDNMKVLSMPENLYNPLISYVSDTMEVNVIPAALKKSEIEFVEDLKKYVSENSNYFKDKELYLIKNKSRNKGVGFFKDRGFYPDFIMWLIANGKQYITFIEPHGMGRVDITSSKVELHEYIKKKVESTLTDPSVVLNSFILSLTPFAEMVNKTIPLEVWNSKHVLFMQDTNYLKLMFSLIEK